MVFAVMLLGSLARADDANGKEQIWEGIIKVREGVELRLVVRGGERKTGEVVATLDSPDEGLKGLKLSAVVLDQSRFCFELKASAAKYEGKLNWRSEPKPRARGFRAGHPCLCHS